MLGVKGKSLLLLKFLLLLLDENVRHRHCHLWVEKRGKSLRLLGNLILTRMLLGLGRANLNCCLLLLLLGWKQHMVQMVSMVMLVGNHLLLLDAPVFDAS